MKKVALAIFISLMLAACGQSEQEPSPVVGVARICRDGSHIFKYRDGTYHTSWGYTIEDIEKVCQP